jgi:hypothetical protein
MSEVPGLEPDAPPSGTGCAECDGATPPGWWVHLRRCTQCGHVGCCDSSPGQHATAHAQSTDHRYIQSFEPGEEWIFDYVTGDLVDPELVDGTRLAPPHSRPEDQPVPGPAGRVPGDWRSHIH